METFLLVLHIILSFVIVVVILLQSGQGGGLGAGFNNAAAMGQEVFGGRGAASFLGKLTVALGALFFVTSMSLAWYSSKPQSALDLDMEADEPVRAQEHDIIDRGQEGRTIDDLPEVEGAEERMQPQMLDTDGAAPDEVDIGDLGGDSEIEVEYDTDGDETSDELRQNLDELNDGAGQQDIQIQDGSPASPDDE